MSTSAPSQTALSQSIKTETVEIPPVKSEPVKLDDVELERPEPQQGSAAPETNGNEPAAHELDALEVDATPSSAIGPTAPALSPPAACPYAPATSQESRRPHAHALAKAEPPPVPPVPEGSIHPGALGPNTQLAHPAPASRDDNDIAVQWPVHKIVGHHAEHSMVEVQWAEQDEAVPLHPLENHYVRYEEISPTLLAEYFRPGPVPAQSPSTPPSYRIHPEVHKVAASDLVRLKYGFKVRRTGTAPCDACIVLNRECEVPSATNHHRVQRSRAAMAPVTAARSSFRSDPSLAAHRSPRTLTRERSPVASSSSSSSQGNTSRRALKRRNAELEARIRHLEGLLYSSPSGHKS
ncbi:hypothetical protein PENSPDRAFT_671149 [Peniophora sp. CONT]|nr:hypothetical protein PENSPDRAFT_671149 [Peniophora sp. CONT]